MVALTINKSQYNIDVDPDMPLLWAIRDHLNLTGTKFGCGTALCGACTVLIDGQPVRSCQTQVGDVGGKQITTIEGLDGRVASAVQAAWQKLDVVQCGYCQSGQIMSAIGLLRRTPKPSDADIDSAMDGNVCRCGTYVAHPRRDPRRRPRPRLRESHHVHAQCTTRICGQAPSRSRRQFLKSTRGARPARSSSARTWTSRKALARPRRSDRAARPNAFVAIAPDNTVTVIVKHLDMGQGNTTGLATIVADELDADWSQMRTEFAPADAALYNNLLFGPVQGTGGSTAIANSWDQLRKAGAAARAMLVAAAADQLEGAGAEITRRQGRGARTARSGQQAKFGELVAEAATLPVPTESRLKEPKDWVYIGKSVPRIDSRRQDQRQGGLLDRHPPPRHADGRRCAHPPRFGGDGEIVRCRGRQGGAGRRRRRADPAGRRGARARHLVGDEGPRRAQGRLGRQRGRDALERRDRARSIASSPEPGPCRGTARRRRRRAQRRRQGDRGRVRVPVPRPRVDGAAQRHHRRQAATARPRSGPAASSRPSSRRPSRRSSGSSPSR